MTERFTHVIPWLWDVEGTKFENDPSDPGGATKFGVDQRSFPREDIRNLTEARASMIYWKVYWNGGDARLLETVPAVCELLRAGLGEVHFGARVNCGKGRANKFLALADSNPLTYLDLNADFYRRLVKARPESKKYLKGWLNRLDSLHKFLNL